MRLDAYLAKQYSDYTRSQLQQYIKAGLVFVNGKKVTKPATDVNVPLEGANDNGADDSVENVNGKYDKIAFHEPATPDFSAQIKTFKKCVIYQDDNVIVINKPAGVLVHAKGGIDPEFTVADYVRSQFNQSELAADPNNNRLGIVHRLDRATSGVMICARNLATQSMLARQFAERKAHKTYLAVTEKEPAELEATINLPIGRNVARPSTFRVDGKGKSAITNYMVLKEYPNGQALVELKPQTGRTHQLRVHLSYIGCPIVGDPIYGHAKYGARLMLHAWRLEITIPGADGKGMRKTFTAMPPAEFDLTGVKLD